jgi:hypothetical protein
MTSGMAHISGGIMAASSWASRPRSPDRRHHDGASTIMMAKMFVPETEVPKTMEPFG